MQIERRDNPAGEVRVVKGGGRAILTGYAAVFDQQSADLGGFREEIAPGAFRDLLATEPDIRALYNHDKSQILGRTRNGTLRLTEDARGLRYEIDLPDTTQARDLMASIERGDVDGSSMGFAVAKTGGERWAWRDGGVIRTVLRVERLRDVGPVTYPAYEGTDAAVAQRSLEEWRAAKPGAARDLDIDIRLAEAGLL